MTPTVRHFEMLHASGSRQMALDDMMLELAQEGFASLRFYGWATPTLSLGYFQKADERTLTPALASLPWLRRATGGDAILHGDGDLTYSLAIPATLQTGEPWLCRFHHHLQKVLEGFGVLAKLVVCGEEGRHGPALCFRHHTPGDITVNGVKVVGSAQRKSRGALLQHGTIRLRQSALVPQLPGIAELAGVVIRNDLLMDALTLRLTTAEGWTLSPAGFTAGDDTRAAHLEAERYANPEWNAKR